MIVLHGAMVEGAIAADVRQRRWDGRLDVTLEEEYLRTSKLLTLPRVLAERLVLPVVVGGPLEAPEIHSDLRKGLGRFLRDNRVRSLVTSAVEEAQILVGHEPTDVAPEPHPEPHPPNLPAAELERSLREALDAHGSDWDAIRPKLEPL
jgi:hypothetical protein